MSKINFDFQIQSAGPVSRAFLALGITSFSSACQFVRNIPYGRNSNRTDRLLVLSEKRGTCSGKHALLAELANEHSAPVQLVMGIFKMTAESMPAAGPVLKQHQLDYLPELHTYLRVANTRLDFTGLANPIEPSCEFLVEEQIQPEQVEQFKEQYHKDYLKQWLNSEGLSKRFDLDSIWAIREQCIAARSG